MIRQDPASGTLFRGDKVTLVVSKGPVLVKVPDVERQAGGRGARHPRAGRLQGRGAALPRRGLRHRPAAGPGGRHRRRPRAAPSPSPSCEHGHRDARPGRATLATLLLVGVTAVWGSTFFLIKDVVRARCSPADFLAVRFVIAAVRDDRGLLASAAGADPPPGARRRRPRRPLRRWPSCCRRSASPHTDASVSGFITGTYVVLTPVLTAVLLRERLAALDLGRGRAGHRRARRCCRCRGSAWASARRDPRVGGRSTPCTSSAWAAGPPRPRRRGSRRCRWSSSPSSASSPPHPAASPCPPGPAPVGLGALHGARGRRPRAVGPDLGAVAPAGDPGGDRDDPRAGVRRRLRRGARRRVADAAGWSSAGRSSSPRCTSSSWSAAAAAPPRSRTHRPSCCTTRCEVGPALLLVGVALLAPGVAGEVVAALLPEAALGLALVGDAAAPTWGPSSRTGAAARAAPASRARGSAARRPGASRRSPGPTARSDRPMLLL